MTDKAPDDNATEHNKPSRLWYAMALALMILGVVGFVVSLNIAKEQVDSKLEAMQRIVAPGSGELSFDEPGDYLIYYEKVGSFNGENFDTTQVFREAPAFEITIQHEASGEFLTIRQAKYDKGESQMFNRGQANSEFVFSVPLTHFDENANTTGKYTMTVAHENEGIKDRVLLAVGPPVVGTLMSDWRGPFGGAALLAFSFVVSATTVLVTWMLRNGKVTRRDD
ncbi:hypothetical protein [Algisphaera agarilytica]|uniref:Uncharacterized protein n=1 Tax=Algisphaera agarilytica TaxID=1385975 RepID=A0A7X0LIV8_9BACT|nr:hypothetical protein [Algisphaera agarilytica]MBB6428655.1 hypothetical protein [Algisphaera agarilytica]